MYHELVISLIALGAGVVGTIYGVKAYYKKPPEYLADQQKKGPETEIMNDSKQTLYDRTGQGEIVSLTLDVRCTNLISTSQIFIHYIADDSQPITYNLRELVEAGHGQELPPSTNVTKVVLNFVRVYPFHKRAQVILENQANQAFRYSSTVEAKYIKR